MFNKPIIIRKTLVSFFFFFSCPLSYFYVLARIRPQLVYFSACACRTLVRHACIVNACVSWFLFLFVQFAPFFLLLFFFFFFLFDAIKAWKNARGYEIVSIAASFPVREKKDATIEQDGRSQLKCPRPRTREYRVLSYEQLKSYKSWDGKATDWIYRKIWITKSPPCRRTFEFEKFRISLVTIALWIRASSFHLVVRYTCNFARVCYRTISRNDE